MVLPHLFVKVDFEIEIPTSVFSKYKCLRKSHFYSTLNSEDLNKYVDRDDVSDWAKDALSWANAEGLVVGHDDRMFASGANADRAQVATILKRFCEGLEKRNKKTAVDPADKPADHPFYFVIRDNNIGRILFAGKYNNTSK